MIAKRVPDASSRLIAVRSSATVGRAPGKSEMYGSGFVRSVNTYSDVNCGPTRIGSLGSVFVKIQVTASRYTRASLGWTYTPPPGPLTYADSALASLKVSTA